MNPGEFLRALLFQQIADDVSEEFLAAEDDSPEYYDAFRRVGEAADERHRTVWSQPTQDEQYEMHTRTVRWWRP